MVQAVSHMAEAIEPRYCELVGWPRVLKSPKALSSLPFMGRERGHPRGQRAWHVPIAAGWTWEILCALPGREVSVAKC